MANLNEPAAHASTRDHVLVITSDFRNGVETLSANPSDHAAVELLKRSSHTLSDVGRQNNLPPLIESGRVLERLAELAEALPPKLPDDALAILSNVHDTLGTIEQLLDWCVEAAAPERQTALLAMLTRAYPDRYRRLLDGDGEAFSQQLRLLSGTAGSTAAAATEPSAGATPAVLPELLEAFETEANERFAKCDELLIRLERETDVSELLHALFREFHTLKGAAAEVGFEHAHRQLHEGESLLAAVRDGTAAIDRQPLVDFLLRLVDSVRGLVDRAAGRNQSKHAVLVDVAKDVARLTGAPHAGTDQDADKSESELKAELSEVESSLNDHLQELATLRAKIAAGEQGPEMLQLLESIDRQARDHSHLANNLRAQVDKIRLTPLDTVFRRLLRPVRDAARKEGKQVDLRLTGGDIRIERDAAERLHPPLLHLVRNAVSHGIESTATREEAGKRPTGVIRVGARRHGKFLVVSVDDDGAGLDYEAIFDKADHNGWIDPAQLPSRQELAQFILRPGFSTRSEADELAGRGVGMDVVAREIAEGLAGRIDIESLDGQGTSVRLSIPLHALGVGEPPAPKPDTVSSMSQPETSTTDEADTQ